MISKTIKLFAVCTITPICLLLIWAALTQPHRSTLVKSIDNSEKIERETAVIRQLFQSRYKVTDVVIKKDSIVVTVDPLIAFSSRYQIKEEAGILVRTLNNTFPGKRITVRIDKPLPNNMIKRYGSGYYDGYTQIETTAY